MCRTDNTLVQANKNVGIQMSEFIHTKQIYPMVSIGLPVFNGEKTIARVIESILSQTYDNFELIISDNYSSDNTESIIRKYVDLDSRIVYIRQNSNIGAEANFKYLLHKSNSKYFMWAASDDIRSNTFLEQTLIFLENNLDYVASTLQTKFEGREFDPIKMGDETLDDSNYANRVIKFYRLNWLSGLHANGRFYSLIRRTALQDILDKSWGYLGADWMIVTHIVSKGKTKRINAGWTELGRYGGSNTQDLFTLHRNTFFDLIAPFNKLSTEVWRIMYPSNWRQKGNILLRLIMLNVYGFLLQFYIMAKRKNK